MGAGARDLNAFGATLPGFHILRWHKYVIDVSRLLHPKPEACERGTQGIVLRLRGMPVEIPHIDNLQIGILNSCNLHKVPLKAAFEIAVPVDRHRDSGRDTRFRVYAMAALDPPQLPAPRLENPTELFAGDGLHTAISINRSVPDRGTS